MTYPTKDREGLLESQSVKISKTQYDKLVALSAKTGHGKIGFHLGRAIDNYLTDEAPVWLQKVAEITKRK